MQEFSSTLQSQATQNSSINRSHGSVCTLSYNSSNVSLSAAPRPRRRRLLRFACCPSEDCFDSRFFFCSSATLFFFCICLCWSSRSYVTSSPVITPDLLLIPEGVFRPSETGFSTWEKVSARSGLTFQICVSGFEDGDVASLLIKLDPIDSNFADYLLSWEIAPCLNHRWS